MDKAPSDPLIDITSAPEDLIKKLGDDLTARDQQIAQQAEQIQDLTDTATTFQSRNSELESDVLQHSKTRLIREREASQLKAALQAKDEEIALLKKRQADRPDLMGSTAVSTLVHPSELPPPNVEDKTNRRERRAAA
jgi:chromosome segregation ATPase